VGTIGTIAVRSGAVADGLQAVMPYRVRLQLAAGAAMTGDAIVRGID
jgi:hypothetical protein